MIDVAADRISKIAVEKSKTRADRISKKQLITAAIAGAFIACLVAAVSAVTMYFVLDARGICAERPAMAKDGSLVCYVDRASS